MTSPRAQTAPTDTVHADTVPAGAAHRPAPAGGGPEGRTEARRGRAGGEDAGGPVQRALAILALLGAPNGPTSLGVVEIARQLGRDKSQVSRVLKLLADAGFVDRESGSLRYRIGTRLFAISANAVAQRLRDEADVLVEREATRLGERVEVCVRSGGNATTISTAAPDTELRAVGWVGRTVPLSCTAAGRALLFDLDDAAVARLLVPHGLAAYGPDAPRSLDEVLLRLAADRERGYALARHEMDRGLVAVGAPVRGAGGRVVAAVAASGPESRLDAALPETIAVVVRASRELSAALGGDGPGLPAASRADPRREDATTTTGPDADVVGTDGTPSPGRGEDDRSAR